MVKPDIRQQFIGAWDLVSYELRTTDGRTLQPLGTDPVGRISYDAAGHMSAHLMRRGVPNFGASRREQATLEEMAAAWRGYAGYFGSYSIDEAASAVIHHVEGAWYPNFVGTDQVRIYCFEGDRLTLQADSASGRTTIVWQRPR
jgi:hypothetical protein